MAFMGIRVPAAAAAELSSIAVPEGRRLEPGEMHITLLYLGKDTPLVSALGAVMGSHTVARAWKPFTVHAALLTSFPRNPDDGVPVIVRVVSEELMKFREEVRRAMDRMSVPYSNKYPEYKPHVTLTYVDEEGVAPSRIRPVSWTVDRMTVWAGEDMDSVVSSDVYLMG